MHRLLQCLFVLFCFFLNYGPDTGIQRLLSLLKVNKNKPKPNNLNSAGLVHVFLDNYKEYPIYIFFFKEILLIEHCEE